MIVTSSMERSSAGETRLHRNHALDGIRGFASLAVLSAHFVVYMGLLPYTPLGAMGVIMFFVLSGYLIAQVCWRSATTWAGYRAFVRRRVRRLAPVAIALCVVGGPVLTVAGDVSAERVARDAGIALMQMTAFASAFGVDTIEPFRPTWSLTVEWTFYLGFPLVLMAMRRSGAVERRIARRLAAIAISLYAVGLFLPPAAFYLLPVANLGVLFAGAALAVWHLEHGDGSRVVDPARTWMALLMLSILTVLPGYTLGWAWKAAILPAATVCTLAVIHGCRTAGSPSRALAVAPLRAVGLRAYSLYLWHVPIMWVVWFNMPGSSAGTRALVAVGVIGVVVPLSFELLERPVLRTRNGPRTTSDQLGRSKSAQPSLEPTNRHGA